MDEIFNYLNEVSHMDPKLIKIRVKNIFALNPEEVERVYKAWKKEFMKVRCEGIMRHEKSRVRRSAM